ncbi:hypothetical protein, partial [Loigolactobacillus bifermentans]|uniref:hypothetical protein n=1 Tax=Loigolactobacillus bifermentans TaxID=1607 RepID=UPI001F2502F5
MQLSKQLSKRSCGFEMKLPKRMGRAKRCNTEINFPKQSGVDWSLKCLGISRIVVLLALTRIIHTRFNIGIPHNFGP